MYQPTSTNEDFCTLEQNMSAADDDENVYIKGLFHILKFIFQI